jgi:TusA-related sulfurtransferase
MKMQADTTLDAGENGCSELIMLIFQKMKTLAPGQTLEVLAHDLAAEIDIPAWC